MGVKVMRLDENAKIVTFALVKSEVIEGTSLNNNENE
jgi:DNA gyrase subunit A